MTVPRDIDDFTPEWLELALGARPRTIRRLTVEPIGGKEGVIGRLFRLELSWSSSTNGAPSSVVAKLTNNQPENLSRPEYRALFEREIRFYSEMARTSTVRTPAVYWAGIASETGAAALLLEDLGRGTIYETGSAPVAAVEAIAREAARLHARWWNDWRLTSMDWLTSEAMWQHRLPRLRDGFQIVRPWYEENAPDLLPLAERMPDAIEAGLFANPGSRTLVHGDLAPKNAAFVDDKVVLFDWQLVGHGTPGYDLANLVMNGFGPVDPSELATRVLAVHYDALRGAGVIDFRFDELREGFARSAMAGLFGPVLQLSVPSPGAGREANARRWIQVAASLCEECAFERRIEEALQR